MKVKFTRNVGVNGDLFAAGQEATLSDADAKYLVLMGKAVPVVEKPEPKPETVVTRDPEPESRDPKKGKNK